MDELWISWETEMSRAVGRRKNEYTIQIHVNKTVILKHCSKSVMNFSIGNTFRHQKFNYYSLFLLHAYVVC